MFYKKKNHPEAVTIAPEFWRHKSLKQMNHKEWEALCDGCGKCCLHKLDNGQEMILSKIACFMLDSNTCQCKNYSKRHDFVPDCIQLKLNNIKKLDWLPQTCAYRLLAEGKELYDWHYLISGDRDTVHQAGISVKGKIVSEHEVVEDIVTAMEMPEYQLLLKPLK